MSKVRRAVSFQIVGLLVGAVAFLVASRFLPIAEWMALVQQKVMHLGVWSAIWYPLLYAC